MNLILFKNRSKHSNSLDSDLKPEASREKLFSLTDALWVIVLTLVTVKLLTGCSSTPALTETPLPATDPPAVAVAEATATPQPAATNLPALPTATLPSPATATPVLPTPTPEPTVPPEIGDITFALGITDDDQPVDAGIFFTKGITQIHAIFDYDYMQPDVTWERVWYLNDKEVARKAEQWRGPESGTFNYFINNNGRPLPAGDWLLELYVADELKSLGVFIIEAAEAATTNNGPFPLVYTKCDGDHHNIYVSDTAGNGEQLIVTRGAGPSWAPGGGAIFFFGEAGIDRQQRDGLEFVFDGLSSGLVAVNANPLPTTINQLNLFQSLEWKQGSARWANVSPDGSMVAFDAKPSGDYRIYFLGTESNQQFRFELIGEQGDWSPDSQQVVYRSGRDGKTGLWISNREDTNHRLITNNGSDAFPAWSPDGQRIAFSRDSGGGNVDIYTIRPDGSDLQRLTDAPGHDTLPTYAPNGDIIFRSARSGSWAIWRMAGDGSDPSLIINNACVGNDWAFSRMDVLD